MQYSVPNEKMMLDSNLISNACQIDSEATSPAWLPCIELALILWNLVDLCTRPQFNPHEGLVLSAKSDGYFSQCVHVF